MLASEINAFAPVGAGRFRSCADLVIEGVNWSAGPWDWLVTRTNDAETSDVVESGGVIEPHSCTLVAGSSTELQARGESEHDAIITDPPFGDNLFYGDLSNFFYVWLRLALRTCYPDYFEPEYVPRARRPLPTARGSRTTGTRMTMGRTNPR